VCILVQYCYNAHNQLTSSDNGRHPTAQITIIVAGLGSGRTLGNNGTPHYYAATAV